jgi:RNA polymerase sigma-70 factor (ECF subfamily)
MILDKASELKMIERVKQNDPIGQRQLYEQFSVQMFRICLRYTTDRNEAEDVLQDGFIKVFRDIAQFRGEGPLGAWIRRIMVNTALSHLRKKKQFITNVPDFEHLEGNDHALMPSFDSNIDAETLMRHLQNLPDGYRAVFNLYAIDGYTHEEIAEQLNISIGTSKSQLFKARDYIKRMLIKVNYTVDGK